jgi:hypothetical protein
MDLSRRALPKMARSKLVKLEADEEEQTDMRRSKEESESSQPAQTLHLATGSSIGVFGAKRLTLRAALKGVRRRCTPPSNAPAESPEGGPGESDLLERPHTMCGLDRKRSRRA